MHQQCALYILTIVFNVTCMHFTVGKVLDGCVPYESKDYFTLLLLLFIYNIRHFVIKAWPVLQLFNGSKENVSQGVKKKRILIYKIGCSFLICQKHLDFCLEGILSVSVPLISVQVVVVVVVQQRETWITNLFAQQPHTSVHDIISRFTLAKVT